MSDQVFDIIDLLRQERSGTLSSSGKATLDVWVNSSAENKALYEKLKSEDFIEKELQKFARYDSLKHESSLKKLYLESVKAGKAPVRRIFTRWIAAASVILIAGYSWWILQRPTHNDQPKNNIASTEIKSPQKNRATIRLSNGNIIYLDSVANGQLATQNNVKLVKNGDGQLVYSSGQVTASQEIVYNTLSNPRGSNVIDMQLSDGSHVWLNAGSSITYPVAFTGDVRKVEMTGEAYFDVVHNLSMPFKVIANGTTIDDLGTSFNVNAYTDEPNLKVTLVQGSAKVSVNNQSKILKPGQQSINTDDQLSTINGVDLDEVLAWKNGRFQFGEKMDITAIMRQISRWYDVDIEYKEPIAIHFGGVLSRQADVSEILKKLELTGRVHFKVEGRKVLVQR